MTTALVPRSDFLGLDGVTHLYTAAEGPLLRRGVEALQEYAGQKGQAEAGRADYGRVSQECKSSLAEMLGVEANDIAFVSSASAGINAVSGLIDFRPGDNVVINDLEFPSVALPWMRLRSQGVALRVVRHESWDITTDALLAPVDDRTRLLAVSHVSYVNSLRHDIEELAKALRGTETPLLVDVTQSLGVLPVAASVADFAISSTYKWLLGTHGLGVLVWNRSRVPEVEPAAIGWYAIETAFTPDRFERYTLRADAGRFEPGFPNFPGIYVLGKSIPYLLAIGAERIADHALSLGDHLIGGLDRLGVEVISPTDRRRRGGSVSFAHHAASDIGRALAEQGVHVWAGDGRVRASTHCFNDAADVERYLNVLSDVLRRV